MTKILTPPQKKSCVRSIVYVINLVYDMTYFLFHGVYFYLQFASWEARNKGGTKQS